ncbi:hypothetical protein AMTRI_Chr08g208820 [Amborella trichopoda]|uniref:BHLH domain-containing protein n=1 Tax=Amborella trichopoda TaxID=13333 RepID=W1PBL2_AMBTC|nr:transcription factor bHLH30 [Amborella trichopoda]ERN05323.1 hypothetical protein AMTR_s00007p00170710 [Amborella trichopoda]|eukprot:XP_006843648.1 transcription factor bHLH30 [Amborella trichopoda]
MHQQADGSHSPAFISPSLQRGPVPSPRALGTKTPSDDAQAVASQKSHSEAERRRRERINGHLSTLRQLLPCTSKMDKASLLREVVDSLKELKRKASEISKDLSCPTDTDELRVELCNSGSPNSAFPLIKASFCCEDRPQLVADLIRALQSLRLRTVKANISTLGGRVRNDFIFMARERVSVTTIQEALRAVLIRGSNGESTLDACNKRQKRILSFVHGLF